MTAPSIPADDDHLLATLAEYATRHGAKSIKDLPGCWEREVDAHWWIAANGSREPRECSKGISVPPFAFYVEFNGWPAAIVDPSGWAVCAGAVANEAALRAALEAA